MIGVEKLKKSTKNNIKTFQTSPRGLFLSTNVVVAFNPEFLTKNDRVFKVQCFYMEMERRIQKVIQISWVVNV